MGGGLDVGKAFQQTVGASLDPFNISGYGGIPGINSNGRTLDNLKDDVTGKTNMDRALAAQQGATGNANTVLGDTYKQQQGYLQPTYNTGQTALKTLAGGNIMDGYKASDAYQFQLGEGQKAINNSMAARGLGNSSAAMKEMARYSQGLASQDAQQYYNNEFNRLNTLAGYGNTAANNMASAAGAYGSNLSNNIMGLGNATAAANIAQANNNSALIGQGIGAGAMLLASDKRVKKNIEEISESDRGEIGKVLKAYKFNYLTDEFGDGDWIGVMAQDLQKHPIGKTLVIENEQGILTIDTKKVLSMFLAYKFSEAA